VCTSSSPRANTNISELSDKYSNTRANGAARARRARPGNPEFGVFQRDTRATSAKIEGLSPFSAGSRRDANMKFDAPEHQIDAQIA
jgi:hypothetical protein